ncbi:hypothetical protein ACFYT3_19935 [Nocardia amikacinitolerans]|uniref:hypothetical protein n=1 Tax=Nocardia amikacinitolerans TaxID=756689 RepID=UPI0020A2B6E7|nr:hypothetical protein [Nocardia amikacinitolerans]MCP2289378.1 hypothetical protein [Nocardia amikacinitolerans]
MISTRKKLGAVAFAAATLIGAFGTVTTAAIAEAAPITAPLQTKAPSTGELRAKMALLFNAGAPRAARAAELETGEAGLPTFDTAATLIAIAPPSWRWDITGPVTVNGDTLSAVLYTATDGYEPWTFDLTWKQIDGTWKLSRESVCTIGNFVGQGC